MGIGFFLDIFECIYLRDYTKIQLKSIVTYWLTNSIWIHWQCRRRKRNRKKNKDTTRRDKNRTNKAFGPQLEVSTFSYAMGGQTYRRGRRTDDETVVQCLQKVLGQTAVAAPDCSTRLAARWVRVCPSPLSVSSVCLPVCLPRLSVHPACGILNFWTSPLGRDLRPETEGGETADLETGERDLRLWHRGAELKTSLRRAVCTTRRQL